MLGVSSTRGHRQNESYRTARDVSLFEADVCSAGGDELKIAHQTRMTYSWDQTAGGMEMSDVKPSAKSRLFLLRPSSSGVTNVVNLL